MATDRQEILRRLEDRLSAVSRWLGGRHGAGEHGLEQLQTRLDSVRRDVSRAREGSERSAHDAVARARATVEDMERDYAVPPPHATVRPEELRALRRHLELTATLLPHISNLDDPRWLSAREEYERSWDEVHRALEGGTPPA